MNAETSARILLSALAFDAAPELISEASAISTLKSTALTNHQAIAKTFYKPKLLRKLRLSVPQLTETSASLEFRGSSVFYESQPIGQTKILFKSALPNELQARLTVESTIERFLDYLLKRHQIVVLHESDHHVQVFIPGKEIHDLLTLWRKFIQNVAFSIHGDTQLQMPGLVQTFTAMLNSITLADRGFSTLCIPILTKDQADILAAWYISVVQQVWHWQVTRTKRIDRLRGELESTEIGSKDFQSKRKKIEAEKATLNKDAEKYKVAFKEKFGKFLEKQISLRKEIQNIDVQLADSGISAKSVQKLNKKKEKLKSGILVPEKFITEKKLLLREVGSDPFKFLFTDRERFPERFKVITELARLFNRKAAKQINASRGSILAQCMIEIYCLMASEKGFDSCPPPLLFEVSPTASFRLPGDDSKQFCYACGTGIELKEGSWKVLRFMFERPSQRRQSSSGEGRPHICASCAVLSIASPLKVTDESIILRLEPRNRGHTFSLSTQDYVRMLSNKGAHISAGKYVIITSDRVRKENSKVDLASSKLGPVQYVTAKVASIFPQEVLADFRFQLVIQGSNVELTNRHLLFVKGLMEAYEQSIITGGKAINMDLGGAVRYVQQDLPYLADYSLVKVSRVANQLILEKIRTAYWQEIKGFMDSKSSLSPRAKQYRDVAALTGLNYAFISSLEKTAKKSQEQKKDSKYAAREVSKIIEKSDEAYVLGYYATLGDEEKKTVQARLFQNPNNAFISEQLLELLNVLGIQGREVESDSGKYIQLYVDDVQKAYEYFASQPCYSNEKGWKDLTYNLKLSLYTRFPELVRKLKSTDNN